MKLIVKNAHGTIVVSCKKWFYVKGYLGEEIWSFDIISIHFYDGCSFIQ